MKEQLAPFLESLQESPVIAAVKSEEGLTRALESECAAVFLLQGTILNIAEQVRRIRDSGKLAFIHTDLINGLAVRDITVDFLHETTQASGIISTRSALIQRANELGLLTIRRFFLLDSMSFDSILHQGCQADAVDILPGTMPRVISRLCGECFGSAATFGMIGQASAPGQIPTQQLTEVLSILHQALVPQA